MASNYRNGFVRPQWHGGAPGRALTQYEERVWREAPFLITQTKQEIKVTNIQLGYSLTGMEEKGPSAEKPLSDKYLMVHNMKYQPLALRPRFHKKALATYNRVYPAGEELPKRRTMEEAGRTTCVFYPDQPNLLLKVCQPCYVYLSEPAIVSLQVSRIQYHQCLQSNTDMDRLLSTLLTLTMPSKATRKAVKTPTATTPCCSS